ncbi:Outer membrane usher protein FimD precursor [compost metagenome]
MQTVVPTRGAIVVARFDTEIGRAMLVVLRNDAGMELPFGAAVFDKDNEQKGIVGPVGRVWLTGLAGANRFTVRWGNDQENQCAFDIEVPAGKSQPEEKSKELTCV